MASEQHVVDYIRTQSGLGSELAAKKMFGEYALYLDAKVVAFVCDNQLYVKPTPAGRAVLGQVAEHAPFPGAKLYFRIDDELDQRELLQRLLRETARALPLPQPKDAPRRRATAEAKTTGRAKA